MANTQVDKIISPLIPSQFPAFYRSQGPNFISFVQEYYRWLEQSDNPQYVGSVTTESRKLLDYFDVDLTSNTILKHFLSAFLVDFPLNIPIDLRFLLKHSLDFYSSKGTAAGINFLFQMLYGIEAKVNIPGESIFRVSDGIWTVPRYIETSDTPFLSQLVGLEIHGSSGGVAVVESYNKRTVKGKVVNILYLSNVLGDFKYNDIIFSPSLEMNGQEPIVLGSLTSVSIDNGGTNFNVGDEVYIDGFGFGGKARVSSVKYENGKVDFQLINGGYGFSLNSIITIDNSGTGGAGASFQIGKITDQQIVSICTDGISGLISSVLDLPSSGLFVYISNASMSFTNGERATGTALRRHLNINYISDPTGPIANGENISNTSLGISALVYYADERDLYITGNSSVLNNANLVAGAVLVSNISGDVISIRVIEPTESVFANGMVIASGSNTTVLSLYRNDANDIGYYVTGMALTGNISGATATVLSTSRLTNWQYFPVAANGSNLDSIIGDTLTTISKTIGRITSISHENPGDGYALPPNVSIIEPLIYELRVDDGKGGYWGFDANVTATAGSANGIVSAVDIIDSGFSYFPGDSLILSSSNNDTSIFGKAVVSSSGIGEGHWRGTQSFLSDTMRLQDSNYYQVFSYEIETEKTFEEYYPYIQELVHPVGYKAFGKFSVNRDMAGVGDKLVYSNILTKAYQIVCSADLDLIDFYADETNKFTADAEGYYQGPGQ